GAAGDLVFFALDELDWAPDIFVTDLPEGARRLRRPSGGYRYTVVGGTVVQADGELTGSRPGSVLRPCRLFSCGLRGQVLLGKPFLVPGKMTVVAQHHHRLAPGQDGAGAGQRILAAAVPSAAPPPHRPRPGRRRPP